MEDTHDLAKVLHATLISSPPSYGGCSMESPPEWGPGTTVRGPKPTFGPTCVRPFVCACVCARPFLQTRACAPAQAVQCVGWWR